MYLFMVHDFIDLFMINLYHKIFTIDDFIYTMLTIKNLFLTDEL